MAEMRSITEANVGTELSAGQLDEAIALYRAALVRDSTTLSPTAISARPSRPRAVGRGDRSVSTGAGSAPNDADSHTTSRMRSWPGKLSGRRESVSGRAGNRPGVGRCASQSGERSDRARRVRRGGRSLSTGARAQARYGRSRQQSWSAPGRAEQTR
jgi:hypothetical protein